MKISETKLLDLLPECMREDRIIKGFSNAWDYLQTKATEKIYLVNLFENLEILTVDQIDQVAAAIDIPWYNTEYEKDKKISIIRHYIRMCFKLGTVESILSISRDIYGDAEVHDWYDYGAPQWRFKISADFGSYTTEEALSKLTRIVRDIKPAKAMLNPVEFLIHQDGEVFAAVAPTTCIFAPDIYDADIN